MEVTYRNFPLCLDNSVYNLCKYLAHSTAPGQCRLQTSKTSSSSFVDFVAFMSAKKEILRSINSKIHYCNFCHQARATYNSKQTAALPNEQLMSLKSIKGCTPKRPKIYVCKEGNPKANKQKKSKTATFVFRRKHFFIYLEKVTQI